MTFDVAIDRLLGNEGGYTTGEGDPGGETKWGISKRSYPDLDIQNLTREAAIEIYRRDFWTPLNEASLPDLIGFQVLDFAVNSGCHTAAQYLQRAVGAKEDGAIGDGTLELAKAMPPAVLLITYVALRLSYMTNLKNWPTAGAGWARRISNDLLLGAQDLLA